jgi:hypothetical protein
MLKSIKNLLAPVFLKGDNKLSNADPSIDRYLCNYTISNAIKNGTPFLASRIGWLEAYSVGEYDQTGRLSSGIRAKLWNTPGIFPETDELFTSFYRIFTRAIGFADLLGLLQCPYEKITIEKHAKSPLLCSIADLEPYFSPAPWSAHLEGKKVLVVHPFEKSINKQFSEFRENIFINKSILPEFHLITLRPPQTLCGNHDGYRDWVHAYKVTVEKIARIDFDVAIVGSGSYGLPIGAFIKEMGKVCVHLGGAVQNLFGITGGRWMEMPSFRALLNPYWVRPLEEERPPNWKTAENGCYW